MATFEIKNFDYENFYKNFNFDEYYEKPCEEYLKQMFFDKCCQSENASRMYDVEASDLQCALERTIEKLHKWHNSSKRYFYFKEKILGKRARNEKKNNFYWLAVNALYIENVQRVIDTDKDYWISPAEVSYRLCDKNGTPLFREKWISSMPCHFLILDLEEARISENLNLDFELGGEQMAELVLEHCRQRGLPEPIIWGDREEVAIVWPLDKPYEKGESENFFRNRKGELVFNEYAFNLAWNDIQNLLYEDFKYLGANPKKKHALTLLRVPGTFNTHANSPVKVLHDAEKTTVEELKSGLNYVRSRVKNYRAIKRPDLQEKLNKFQKEHEEFLNFWDKVEGTEATTTKVAPKPEKSKFEPVLSKSKKAKLKREQRKQNNKTMLAAANKNRKEWLLKELDELSSKDSSEAIMRREDCERELWQIEKYERDRNFLEQIKQDVLQIHLAGDHYVFVCFKSKKENWRQIAVQSKNLEKKLTELCTAPDFYLEDIYVTQIKFLSDKSRAIDNVASLSVSFLDIDGKLATEHKDLSPEEWSNLILEYCREKDIPLPSIIVFSGNGLHVKWLYKKAITREYLNRWTMLQRKLWLIFKDFGADAQAKDAARVLRLPGTKNCKPGTKDRDVRVVYSNPERYSFGDFAKKIFELPGYDDAQELYEEFKAADKPKPEVAKVVEPEIKEIKGAKIETSAPEPKQSDIEPKPEEKPKKSITTPSPLCDSPYFKFKNENTGEEKFVKKSEIPDYLKRQDKTHVLKRSISEFEQPDSNTVERIYCNYTVLSAEKVRGSNLKEKAMTVLKRSSEYWNGLGIPMPNALMLLDEKLIVAWKYFDYLPGKALSRWQRTQEIINYHFADWGAKDSLEYQEVSALLPIAEFTNNKAEVLKLNARYKFDDIASKILRFSQDEVREYKKKKAEEKAKAKAERDLKNLASFKKQPKKRTGSFAGQAARRFADIVKLMELRANSHGEVQEGHRELSVFWAMNFAVQAEMVSTVEEFDALTQKLIDKNGVQFQSETSLKLFGSLKNKFISKTAVYNAKTETIIEQLGITTTEQAELEVLRYFPKKEKKPRQPSIESLEPWEAEGISRRKWYYDRAAEKEKLNGRDKYLSSVVFKAICTTFSYIMRGRRESLNYRESYYKRVFVSDDFVFSRIKRERDFCSYSYTSSGLWKNLWKKYFVLDNRLIFYFDSACVVLWCQEVDERTNCGCGFLLIRAPIASKISKIFIISAIPDSVFFIRPPPIFSGKKEQKINRKEVLFVKGENVKDFIERWLYRGDEKSDTQKFWLGLLRDVLDFERAEALVEFEKRVALEHVSYIDVYIPSTRTVIEQKSFDVNLDKAVPQSDGSTMTPFQQAKRYSDWLPDSERAHWIVTCNFQEFRVYDMEKPKAAPTVLKLADLRRDWHKLAFLADINAVKPEKREVELSVKAGQLVGILYDSLIERYINPNDKESQRSLNIFCVRVVFLLYAEDSGLFEKNQFHNYLKARELMARDSLRKLFEVLNQKIDERDPYLEADLNNFPYVNGGLFEEKNIELPQLDGEPLRIILEEMSEGFDWSEISPTIFGAVFESTLNPETRHSGGMHYTSIENIHKVIDPLFLNALNAEFDAIMKKTTRGGSRTKSLEKLQEKLASLKFFDPACGSGNFLNESYLSLRRLENEIILELSKDPQISFTDSQDDTPIKISISQFYGLEINDFAVAVAKTALWIAEAQMWNETKGIIHFYGELLPLKSFNNIIEANALKIDWRKVVKPGELNFIMGNPPFLGYSIQNKKQKQEILSLFVDEDGKPYKSAGKIDYVAGWYFKAAEFIQNTKIKAAFVSTNSVTQGEQVAGVFKPLSERFNIHVDFAWRTFIWKSEAQDKAQVHVVIIGFSSIEESGKLKRLYKQGDLKLVENINFYLVPAPNVFAESRQKPISDGVPEMTGGNRAADGGNLIIEAEDYAEFIRRDPKAKKFIKRYMMGDEFINGKVRYCLWLVGVSPQEIQKMPLVMERVRACREDRLKGAPDRQKLADIPHLFRETLNPSRYVAIPVVSSEKRSYIPIGWLDDSVISGNKLMLIPNATLYHFGVLTSRVHMAWMRSVGGRLKSDYSYSKTIVYNCFVWPSVSEKQREKIEVTAQKILDARALYPDSTFATLYDETLMPIELRKAHRENDAAVCEAYGFSKDISEEEIVSALMSLYEKISKE